MKRVDAQSSCPHCRKTCPIVVPDLRAKGQTMSLKVQCIDGDCTWRGELTDYNNHITEKCPNRVVQCQYGCGLCFISKEVEVHEREECTHRPYEVLEESSRIMKERYEMMIGDLEARIQSLEKEVEERKCQFEESGQETGKQKHENNQLVPCINISNV